MFLIIFAIKSSNNTRDSDKSQDVKRVQVLCNTFVTFIVGDFLEMWHEPLQVATRPSSWLKAFKGSFQVFLFRVFSLKCLQEHTEWNLHRITDEIHITCVGWFTWSLVQLQADTSITFYSELPHLLNIIFSILNIYTMMIILNQNSMTLI